VASRDYRGKRREHATMIRSEQTVPQDQLTIVAVSALRECGASEQHADAIAAALIWNDSIGRITQGTWRLPVLCDRLKRGGINPTPSLSLSKRGKTVTVLNADGASGHYAGQLAMRQAIEKARSENIGVVGVVGSNYFGSGAYFVDMCLREKMIGIAMSNSFPKVLPFGGSRPALGTNPMAFGAPRKNGDHFLLDMATSAEAGSTVRKRNEEKDLPAQNDALQPLAGPKGFGLALMIEILSAVLTGAGMSHEVLSMYASSEHQGENGHFFLAMDITAWMPLADYYQRIEQLFVMICGGNPDVVLPGQVRYANRERSRVDGIPLDPGSLKAIRNLHTTLDLERKFEWLK